MCFNTRESTGNKALSLFFFYPEVKFMNMYSYDGPVMEFDNCVANRWIASTRAVSEKKARSNLTYQFKKKNNRLPGTKIILPGKISLVSGKETT